MGSVVVVGFFFLLSSAAAISTGGSTPTDFVREECRRTRYPAECEQCLAAYAQAVHRSRRELARAALAVSAERARDASAFVSRMSAGGEKSLRSREAGAVRDCLETMRDSVDRLRQSVKEMGAMGRARTASFRWHLSNVQTWVSAALTDESTCLDGLSQVAGPAVRAAIRKKVLDVAHVTSNALALVNHLGPNN